MINPGIWEIFGEYPLDENFRIVNQHLKFLKRGLGHVTDQVCEAIHLGKMTREEAIENVKNYDGSCDEKYIQQLCEYLNISEKEFHDTKNKFVNKKLFEFLNGKWLPKFKVGETWKYQYDYGMEIFNQLLIVLISKYKSRCN